MSFRWGGQVLSNRERFLIKVGVGLEMCVGASLEHETKVTRVETKHRGMGMRDPETAVPGDAFLTNAPGTFLFLLTGDCLPIAVYDPMEKVVGLVHASRKNSPLGLMRKVIDRMEEWYGSKAKNIVVSIGPGVRKESYIFPPVMKEELMPIWKKFLIKIDEEKFALDVVGMNSAELRNSGVREENIHVAPQDTIADPAFFSHYRSRLTGEAEGRMATVLGIKS